MATVAFEGVEKVYPDGTHALRALDLKVSDGEFMVFVGPSGCGKTTALRMVAGLEAISRGVLRIGGRVVNEVECGERDIAMVFQNYALYPHMSVFQNMNFPLRLMGMPRSEREARIRAIAAMLGLEDHLHRKPGRLSGGQRQRVAMGRALVREPQVFLMDEPLSNLDAKLRVQTRAEIAKLQRRLGITTVYVTHDQVEAMTMGDRVAVMRKGFLQQVDDAQILYDRPANLFVAAFIGSPPMNLLVGRLDGRGLHIGPQTIRLAKGEAPDQRGEVVVGVRPEQAVAASGAGEAMRHRILSGKVAARESVGSDLLVTLAVDGLAALAPKAFALAHDDQDPAENAGVLVGRFSPALRLRHDEPFAAALPVGSLRFFDPETGAALPTAGPASPTPALITQEETP